MDDLLGALLLFAPAGIANTAPVWVAKMPLLSKFNTPLDLGRSFRGKRIFGQNKTIRGLLSGAIVGAIVAVVATVFINNFQWVAEKDLVGSQINFILLGALTGFGALVGDAVESFFKRQLNKPPSKPWFPFDQVDYIFGGMIFVAIFIDLQPIHYVWIFVCYTLFHPFFSYLAYLLKLKDDKF